MGTFLSAIRKTFNRNVDLTLKSLMYWGVIAKPGCVAKQAVAPSDNKMSIRYAQLLLLRIRSICHNIGF